MKVDRSPNACTQHRCQWYNHGLSNVGHSVVDAHEQCVVDDALISRTRYGNAGLCTLGLSEEGAARGESRMNATRQDTYAY